MNTHIHALVAVAAVGQAERCPAGLVYEVLVPAAVLLERRRRHDGAGVDDAPHRLGPLALLKDRARRVDGRFDGVLAKIWGEVGEITRTKSRSIIQVIAVVYVSSGYIDYGQ